MSTAPTSSTGGSEPSTSGPPATGSAPSGSTLGSGAFAEMLASTCAQNTGQPLLAEELAEVQGTDGSGRLVEIVTACDVEFIGEVVPELGRPSTNIEALIDDPANNVTPNQAQLDVLNSELALYWRIAQSVVATLDPTAVSTTVATTPASTDSTVSTVGSEPSTSAGSTSSTST